MKQTLLLIILLFKTLVVNSQELKQGTYTINGLSFKISHSTFARGGILIAPTIAPKISPGPEEIEGFSSGSIAASVKFDKPLLDLTILSTQLSQGRVDQIKANKEVLRVSVTTDVSGKVLSSSLVVPKNSLITKMEAVKILSYLNSCSYRLTSFRGLHKNLGYIIKDEIFRF